MVTIRIAELNIALQNKYEYTKEYVKDYITDGEPDFTVSATEEDIIAEVSLLGENAIPHEQIEPVVLYRKIAEQLPKYGGAVFHGTAILDNGRAYIFTAPSGVGKTTHSRLWLSAFGDKVCILNGDKPIIRIIDGVPYVCGTPWQGKERYGINAIAPLSAVAFLSRGKENAAREICPQNAATRFMSQIYLDRTNAQNLLLTMRLSNEILSLISLVEMECNMELGAARVAREAILDAIKNSNKDNRS